MKYRLLEVNTITIADAFGFFLWWRSTCFIFESRRSSIAMMTMPWVESRAQLRVWFISLVTKPGAAFCKNARISSFILRRTYHLGHAFYALDLVWEGPTKKWHFCPPTGHPYRFQKFERHLFYFSLYAVCVESLVGPFSSVGEIAGYKKKRKK